MNKSLAWVGSIAGALSAALLIVGLPSWNGFGKVNGCTSTAIAASTSRALQWSGGDSLEIGVPGSVHFKVGPEWRAVAAGPAEAIKHVRIRNGKIEFDRSFTWCTQGISIELTGPAVQRWILSGSGDLFLEALDQGDLDEWQSATD